MKENKEMTQEIWKIPILYYFETEKYNEREVYYIKAFS